MSIETRPILTLALALLLVAPAGAAAGQGASVVGTDDGFALAIHATADLAGTLDPCGCKVPLGGIARRSGYAKALEASLGGKAPVLQLDAGHLFMAPQSKEFAEDATFMTRNEWVLRGSEHIGLNAANVAAYDLPFLATMTATAGYAERAKAFPMLERFVSANVVPASDDVRPFAPYRIVELQGPRFAKAVYRVAIFGVAEPPKEGAAVAGYTVTDPAAAVRKYASELRGKADLVVLLAYAGFKTMRQIEGAANGVDLIFVASELGKPKAAAALEVPVTTAVASQGRYVSELRVHIGPEGRASRVERRVVALDPDVPNDGAAARVAHDARAAIEAAESKRAGSR